MLYYLRRIQQLGLRKSINRIESFFENRYWKWYWKCRLKIEPHITCPRSLVPQVKLEHCSFFLQHPVIKKERLHQEYIESKELFIRRCKERKTIIFNQEISLEKSNLWKKDPLSQITIDLKNLSISEQLSKPIGEIRNAWELGRMHHLFKAALFFKQEQNTEHKKILSDFIIEQILSWQTENPFMSGIHWYNAMEVAIRATNLLFVAYLLESTFKEEKCWQTLVDILYQHKLFINSHWETSATPNNHYLADLIGYGHLLLFFNETNKTTSHHLTQTLRAFKVQILSDDWAYEGSTGYHRLDTELLLHLTLLMQWSDHPSKKEAEALFSKAYEQLILLQGTQIEFASIGDNDDGKMLTGISIFPSIKKTDYIDHAPEAGISIISQNKLHLIMRHAIFNPKSPSGHYHRDDLSFMLSWQGVSLFIDPGSGIYTGNKDLRNQMRAWDAHNTIFCKDELHPDLNEPLFQLTKKRWHQQPIIIKDPNQIKIVSKRPLYCTPGFIVRTLLYAENNIQISDQIISDYLHEVEQTLIIHPSINTIQKNQNKKEYEFLHNDQKIAFLISEAAWQKESFYMAKSFGSLTPCTRLRATHEKETTYVSYNIKL